MNDSSKLPQVNGASQLVRPSYSPGLMLQDDDLKQAVDYTRDLSRLLFKNLFGCGVVCGFKITLDTGPCNGQVVIQPGVAIDGHGDPVELRDPQRIDLGTDMPDETWITIRRRDIHCLKRDLACAADDDDTAMVTTRIRDGYEIRLVRTRPDKACSCIRKEDATQTTPRQAQGPEDDPCYRAHYAGECSCGCGAGSDDVVLARLYRNAQRTFDVDFSVRRFIRPALIVDPLLQPTLAPTVAPSAQGPTNAQPSGEDASRSATSAPTQRRPR
jgi:hypothetical protein